MLDWALFADLACLFDVGDVFVVFWEHLVGFSGAVCVLSPVCCCVCIGWFYMVLLVLVDFMEGVHSGVIWVMHPVGMTVPCAWWLVL